MKYVRFFEEYTSNANKRKRISAGNVLALLLDERGRPMYDNRGFMDAIAGVYPHPNSAVASTQVAHAVLDKYYRRISEKRARVIHPKLFKHLDTPESE